MTSDRRRTLLLSVLAALAFWLAVDGFSRLPLWGTGPFYFSLFEDGFLAPLPGWKRLVLVAVVAGVFYATARLIALASPRRWVRRVLWPLALVGLWFGSELLLDQAAEHYSPFHPDRLHQPLRFEQATLAGTAWWNIVGGDCGYFGREEIAFESETRATRSYHGAFGGSVIYVLLDVWPEGTWTEHGVVRDDVIYWEEGNTYEIVREGHDLRVTWGPDWY